MWKSISLSSPTTWEASFFLMLIPQGNLSNQPKDDIKTVDIIRLELTDNRENLSKSFKKMNQPNNKTVKLRKPAGKKFLGH